MVKEVLQYSYYRYFGFRKKNDTLQSYYLANAEINDCLMSLGNSVIQRVNGKLGKLN